ncbi:MAG: glycosyl transferase family 2 [Chlorobi bacterium OLB5]|nr:MAG: glycosyl transferase family 2 [Chlorobi bacterium OLB5]
MMIESKKRLIWGYGITDTFSVYSDYMILFNVIENDIQNPHNAFISAILMFGLIFVFVIAIFYLFLLYKGAKLSLKSRKSEEQLFYGFLVSVIITSFALGTFESQLVMTEYFTLQPFLIFSGILYLSIIKYDSSEQFYKIEKTDLISVILITYNAEEFVRLAIDSVLNQTYRDFELIIIDDGSIDNTIEIIKDYTSKSDRIISMFYEHSGNVGKLRNEAIKISKGEYIAIIDGDDIWSEEKLMLQIQFMEQFDLICTNANEIDSANNIIKVRYFQENIPEKLTLDFLAYKNYVITSSVLMRKDIVIKAGMFEDDVGIRGEDYILWLNIAQIGNILFLDRSLIKYRRHTGNLSYLNIEERKKLLLRTIDIRRKFWDKIDPKISRMSKLGCADIFSELFKINFKLKNYSEALSDSHNFLSVYNEKLSIRYLKFLLVMPYLKILKNLKEKKKSKN